MNLRRLKHTLLRLSLEEKVIGIGAIVIMIGCFLPWYSTSNIVDNKVITEYGLSGDLGVIGFVIFLMSLLGLLAMISENMHLPFPKFGYKRESIVLFFIGQSAFLSLLTMAVYTKRSLEFTEAGLRFGIYLVLAAGFFSALAAFALIRKSRKKEVMAFFEHEQYIEPENEEKDFTDEQANKPEEENVDEVLTFQEDREIIDEIDQAFEEKERDEPKPLEPEQEPKEEIIKNNPQEPKQDKENTEIKPNPNQANYFTREAGIAPKEEKKETPPSMNFYNDK